MFLKHIEFDVVTKRLGHLSSVGVEPHSVCNDRSWTLYTGGQQECRPIDCMKSQDVLTDQVECRPKLFKTDNLFSFLITKADRRDVIRQCIKPNVHCMCRVVWYWNSPTH